MNGFWQLRITVKSKDGKIESEPEKTINPEDLPKSFHVGQDYIQDKERISVLIEFKFKSAVVFSNINFEYRNMLVRQENEGEIVCKIKKSISKKLFNDIVERKDINTIIKATPPIMGYIEPYLPSINTKIQEQKYLEGHILSRMISLSDIYDIFVFDGKDGGVMPWPSPLSGFSPSKLTTRDDAVYIRDVIDAMTSYFQYDLDDCIRKVITSLENCFEYHELKLPPKNFLQRVNFFQKKYKINRLVEKYIKEKYYPYPERDLKKLRENIMFIYQLRNLVVHDKLRIHPSQTTVCAKAIDTLLYLYQGSFMSTTHRGYLFSFKGQFLMIRKMYNGYNLDAFEWNLSKREKNVGIINSPDDMNKWIFEGLRITKKERKSILSGTAVVEHFTPNARGERPKSQ